MIRKEKMRLNNKGSALVSVLVVTIFISILATTMLYVSAQNYQMKYTDYQNKQSFYGAEHALDSLKAIMIADVQTAYEEAYHEVMRNYLLKGTVQGRKECYQEAYLKKLNELWDGRLAAAGGDCVKMMRDFMTDNGIASDVAERIYKVEGYGESEVTSTETSGGVTTTMTGKQFTIKGVRAMYTSGNYTTFLYTDIGIALPELDLSVDSSQTLSGTAAQRKLIALTDCVLYMNWRRADYEE